MAEIAKAELDDTPMRGRQLRVRFATHAAALSVRNLSPYVSNELLEEAFSQFGPIERAVVIVEDFSPWFLLGFELCDINSLFPRFPTHVVFRALDRRLRIS